MKELSEWIISVFIFVLIIIVSLLITKSRKAIGMNINNEIKEYKYINKDYYGVTEDGTRELLKSYKFKK